jgi:hypothetical protein
VTHLEPPPPGVRLRAAAQLEERLHRLATATRAGRLQAMIRARVRRQARG